MDFKMKKYELKIDNQVLKDLKENCIPVANSLILVLSEDGELTIKQWPGKRAMAWCERIVLLVK
jgi:hypothetical protein